MLGLFSDAAVAQTLQCRMGVRFVSNDWERTQMENSCELFTTYNQQLRRLFNT